MRVSRTGYDLRKLRICMIVGTTVAGGKKFESYPVNPFSLHEESELVGRAAQIRHALKDTRKNLRIAHRYG